MRRATVLVADRNSRFLEKTAQILAQAGHTMLAARDGRAARLKLTRGLDGLLAHATLPGLSGYELCRLAKEKDPGLPVILMFSAEDPLGEAEARKVGADNWLVRPLKRLELLYIVRDLVKLRALAPAPQSEPPGGRLLQFELFKRLLGIELKRSQRYGFPLSLLLAALDRPLAGKHDLLATAARGVMRDIDIPVAFAASDLLVMMPHTELGGARLVAERLRQRVRAQATTVSVGLASASGGQRLTFAALLAQATQAQRAAARAGGDRVLTVP